MIKINLLTNRRLCSPHCLTEKATTAAELLRFRSGEAGNPLTRVAQIADRLCRQLQLSEQQRHHILYGALLHDLGKMNIPASVLEKVGPLDLTEWAIMKTHPALGGRELRRLGFPPAVRHAAFYHHEQFDGSGYPGGLAGLNIPLAARIVTIADAYDAMRSKRCYKAARSHAAAVGELQRCAGTQFDPALVTEFVRIPENELDT